MNASVTARRRSTPDDLTVRLYVTWIAKPGAEARVKEILMELSEASSREIGCLRYTVCEAVEDPQHFVLYEEYRDSDAFRSHTDSEHFKRLVLTAAAPLLESRKRIEIELVTDHSVKRRPRARLLERRRRG